MQDELEEIKEVVDKTSGDGRDEELARSLADTVVRDNPSQFNELENKTVEELCAAIDVFRAAGDEAQVWRIEAWLLHRFEPQNIGGSAQPAIRNAGL